MLFAAVFCPPISMGELAAPQVVVWCFSHLSLFTRKSYPGGLVFCGLPALEVRCGILPYAFLNINLGTQCIESAMQMTGRPRMLTLACSTHQCHYCSKLAPLVAHVR